FARCASYLYSFLKFFLSACSVDRKLKLECEVKSIRGIRIELSRECSVLQRWLCDSTSEEFVKSLYELWSLMRVESAAMRMMFLILLQRVLMLESISGSINELDIFVCSVNLDQ
ncbi:251_t:CDS:2, partial [Ambispora gerdemannii]